MNLPDGHILRTGHDAIGQPGIGAGDGTRIEGAGRKRIGNGGAPILQGSRQNRHDSPPHLCRGQPRRGLVQGTGH